MPKEEKDSLLKELSKNIENFNKKNKRKLFLDSIGGAGVLAGVAGAAGGLAMANMGSSDRKMELERLEGELRSMKFRMMMKMGERGQEISNIEVKVIFDLIFRSVVWNQIFSI